MMYEKILMMIMIKSQMKKVCDSNQLSLVNIKKIIIEKIVSVIINVNVTDIHWSLRRYQNILSQKIKLVRTFKV